MRLKYSVMRKYRALTEFWQGACRYAGNGCRYPEAEQYRKTCDEIWAAWRKAGARGKAPAMPPETIACEKCRYADKSLGRFQGQASGNVISRHTAGTVPVPLQGRKKIWLDNVNQKQLEAVIKDFSPKLEAFAVTGSPSISSFAFLESFPKLRTVSVWWNTKAVGLWDMRKTPAIERLNLEDTRVSDLSPLQYAAKLKYLDVWGGAGALDSLKPLEGHANLEFLALCKTVTDMDVRPLISLPKLRYLHAHFNLFDIRSYAMFEARRPDVATTFFEGLDGFAYEKPHNLFWVGLVGKRQGMAKQDDRQKQEKHRRKYIELREKLRTADFVPVVKTAQSDSPAAGWRAAIEDGSNIHTIEEVGEIETILNEYASRMRACNSKAKARAVLKETVAQIAAFNRKTGFIETEEGEELYEYLVRFLDERWYDALEELVVFD